MATVTRNIDLSEIIEPIEGVGTQVQAVTPIPQHVLIAYAAVLASAPGAGNNIQLFMNYQLPDGYAYKMTDFSYKVGCQTAADLNGFSTVMVLDVEHEAPSSGVTTGNLIPCNSWGNANEQPSGTADAFRRSYVPERIPTYPLNHTPAFALRSWLYNSVAATADMTVDVFIRFLAYDQQQYDYWPIHTPVIVVG